jgi:hypothetical protein
MRKTVPKLELLYSLVSTTIGRNLCSPGSRQVGDRRRLPGEALLSWTLKEKLEASQVKDVTSNGTTAYVEAQSDHVPFRIL